MILQQKRSYSYSSEFFFNQLMYLNSEQLLLLFYFFLQKLWFLNFTQAFSRKKKK